jgi:hypothetical protein
VVLIDAELVTVVDLLANLNLYLLRDMVAKCSCFVLARLDLGLILVLDPAWCIRESSLAI